MFAFDRSAFAVLLPLALLFAVVLWSNRESPVTTVAMQEQRDSIDAPPTSARRDQTLAANLPSR